MDFRGADLGPGLGGMGDLLYKGWLDRQELARQQTKDDLAEEAHDQSMQAQSQAMAQAVQRANKETGYLNDNPREFSAQGGSMVPAADLSGLGGDSGFATPPASSPAYTPPIYGTGGPAPASIPTTVPNSPLMDPSSAQSPDMTTDVDQNAMKNQVYQQNLTHIMTSAPPAAAGVDPQSGKRMVTPYEQSLAMNVAEQHAKLQQALAEKDKYIEGRQTVAQIAAAAKQAQGSGQGTNLVGNIIKNRISILQKNMESIDKDPMLSDDDKEAKKDDLQDQIDTLTDQAEQLSGGKSAKAQAAPAQAPVAVVSKKYSPSTNKTYSLDAKGKVLKVEDGHVY